MSTGGRGFENFAWGLITQRLVKPFVVVEQKPFANAAARRGDRGIGVEEGEWRGTSQPRALSEPDVNLSIHPAPIIRPLVPGSSGRTS